MNHISYLVVSFAGLVALANSAAVKKSQQDTLRLLHVIHRHGDRTPDQGSVYSANQFTDESWYLPYGWGQLTDDGKMREFIIGTELRKSYKSFLGDVYNINILDARSTNVNRTKASIELSLAGLWPPARSQRWNRKLNWQPIPYNYQVSSEDKELYWFSACTQFNKLLAEVLQSETISNYLNSRYNESIYQVMNANNVPGSFINAFGLWFTLKVQEEMGLPHDEWTKQVYPEPLHSLAVDYYYVETNTTALRKITAGYYLKKVLADSAAKINGTLTPSARKLFLYSAHEQNTGTLVLSLDAFKLVDVPAYGSHVIIELHEIEGVWGFKLLYQDWASKSGKPHVLTIPGCKEFCPYDQFVSLVSDILPESDAECFGSS